MSINSVILKYDTKKDPIATIQTREDKSIIDITNNQKDKIIIQNNHETALRLPTISLSSPHQDEEESEDDESGNELTNFVSKFSNLNVSKTTPTSQYSVPDDSDDDESEKELINFASTFQALNVSTTTSSYQVDDLFRNDLEKLKFNEDTDSRESTDRYDECSEEIDISEDEYTENLLVKQQRVDLSTKVSSLKDQNLSSEIVSCIQNETFFDLINKYPKLKAFYPSQEAYKKVSRKEADIPNSLGIKEGVGIFVHTKTSLGRGCSKVAFAAELITFSGESYPVTYKKLLTNSKKAVDENAVKKAQREIRKAVKEAELQSNFNHESIVKLLSFDLHSENTKVAIYEEACEGTFKNTFLTKDEQLTISIDIANALAYLHEQGYSHNDIKLNNMFIKDRRGKLGDFGNTALIGSRFFGYKKNYAPEQQEEKAFGNEKTDVYQFGLCLWNLFCPIPIKLSSEYPSRKGAVDEMFLGWENDDPMKDLVRQCLDPNPSNRPTMKAVVTSLKKI